MLQAETVSVRRGGRAILDRASIRIEPGEVAALIGPNGAGKSTLLHVCSGRLAPETGRVLFDGRPLPDWPRRALALRRAVLEQSFHLDFPFRVMEVVLLGRSPHAGRSSRENDLAIATQAMRETDVLGMADRLYPSLSGGERQRVHLARALAQIWPEDGLHTQTRDGAMGARCLMLDEPTNNLDLAHQHGVLSFARSLAERGIGVLAVLHDPNLAALYADRIFVLRQGRVVAEGTPEDVLTPALFQETFGIEARIMRHPSHGYPYMVPG